MRFTMWLSITGAIISCLGLIFNVLVLMRVIVV